MGALLGSQGYAMTMNLRTLLDARWCLDIVVGDLVLDSRQVKPGDAFVALPGSERMVGSILKRRSSAARQLYSARRRAPRAAEILVSCRYLRCAPGWVC